MSNGHPQVLAHQGAPGKYGAWPTKLVDSGGRELAVDAFFRLKTVQPFTLADIVNKYEVDSRTWQSTTVGGGASIAHVPAESAIRLTVSGTNGDTAQIRTHDYFRYQAGKATVVTQTCYSANAGVANQTRRWGMFDANDGLFWELAGTAFRVVRRTSVSGAPVDNTVAQTAWNVDKMDGTGPSRITLDLTKNNIYEIDFQWLSAGLIRFYVNHWLVHQLDNSNLLVGPYMRTAVLPVTAEVVNTAGSTGSSLTYICTTVESSGGTEPPEESFGAYNSADVVVGPSEIPLMSVRNKLTYNSIANRIVALPSFLTVWSETSRATVRVVFNNTLTGASFASATVRSAMELDTAATAFASGETIIESLVPPAFPLVLDLSHFFRHDARKMRLSADAATPDIFSVLGLNLGPGNTNMRASLTWREIR